MLPELEAERQLLAIQAASVPHMKEAAGRAVLDRWLKRLRGNTAPKSMAEALAATGIPMKRIPKATKAPRGRAGRAGTGRDETEGQT